MTPPFAGGHLGLGRANVAEQLQLVDEGFVGVNVEQDGGPAPVLGQEDGRAGLTNLLDDLGGVGAELRDGLDVTGGLELGHGGSQKTVRNNVPNCSILR